MTFFWRLGLLVVLLATVAWIDWRRRGVNATKWREYGALLAAGLLGGLLGMAIDNTTATISPDFFVLSKGLSADVGFRGQVTEFGFHAGLVAGLVVGGVYLLANNPKPARPSLPYQRLLKLAGYPLLGAAIAAPLSAGIICLTDPLDLGADMTSILTPRQLQLFLAVWGINLGCYLGGLLGVVWGVVRIRTLRAQPA